MKLRTVASLNWLVGIVAIAGAVLYPMAREAMVVGAARTAAETLVMQIADAEKREFQLRNGSYFYFPGQPQAIAQASQTLSLTIPTAEFLFDAVSDAQNILVLRAYTAPSALQSGSLPPMMYRYSLANPNAQGVGKWEPLSGRSAGVLGLFQSLTTLF